jgi:hypothetical protein
MTSRTRSFVILSLSVIVVGVGTGLTAYYVGFPARALFDHGPDELQYVPSDVAVVAYADVREVMASELRQRVKRALPGQENGHREFQNQTGINIETDIDHVVACLGPAGSDSHVPGSGMVLASGLFDEVKIEALMREHGAIVEHYKGKRLIVPSPAGLAQARVTNGTDPSAERSHPAPEFALSFFKPGRLAASRRAGTGLVAVGNASLIRRAVDLENGGENITRNDDIMNLVKSLDSGNAWAVGRFDAIRSAARFPQGLDQLPAITWFSVTGQVNNGISGVVRAQARDDESATNLRKVVDGFLALAKLQAGSKPELQALIQSLNLSGHGRTVALSFSVPGAVFDLIHADGEKASKKQPAH